MTERRKKKENHPTKYNRKQITIETLSNDTRNEKDSNKSVLREWFAYFVNRVTQNTTVRRLTLYLSIRLCFAHWPCHTLVYTDFLYAMSNGILNVQPTE